MHDHDHAHGGSDYYLEQIVSIFICGAFGLVAILMNLRGMLNAILKEEFHNWLLIGGGVLIAFVALRGLALWQEVGQKPAHDHNHSHDHHHHDHAPGESCGHDHSHDDCCGDDHGHSHGGIFWRAVVLAFPILLFLMGLPGEGFSNAWKESRLGNDGSLGDIKKVTGVGGAVLKMDFAELNASANDEGKRKQYEGKTVSIVGQLRHIADNEYTLFKMKMNCCAADMIPLKARIRTEFSTSFKDYDWVRAEGVLQFVPIPGKDDSFVPVISVGTGEGLQASAKEP